MHFFIRKKLSYLITHSFANVLYLSICMLGNSSCFYLRLLTFFKIKFLQINHPDPPWECQTVWIKIKTDILLVFIWVQTVCKRLLADDNILLSMQRVTTVKYFSVHYIISYRYFSTFVCVYVYHKYSDTLNTFRHAMPFKQSKSNIQRI